MATLTIEYVARAELEALRAQIAEARADLAGILKAVAEMSPMLDTMRACERLENSNGALRAQLATAQTNLRSARAFNDSLLSILREAWPYVAAMTGGDEAGQAATKVHNRIYDVMPQGAPVPPTPGDYIPKG